MNFPSAHHPLRSVHAMRFCCASEDNQTELFRFAEAAFDAYYTDQANLDDPAILIEIASVLDLDAEQLSAMSQQQVKKDHLCANTDEAIACGAFGSPSVYVPFGDGERLYFGNDQLTLVEWAILQG